MPLTMPKIRFGKALEILLWVVAVAVLAENVSLFRQNQRLHEALAPKIAAGTQLQMLSGLALDPRQKMAATPRF